MSANIPNINDALVKLQVALQLVSEVETDTVSILSEKDWDRILGTSDSEPNGLGSVSELIESFIRVLTVSARLKSFTRILGSKPETP